MKKVNKRKVEIEYEEKMVDNLEEPLAICVNKITMDRFKKEPDSGDLAGLYLWYYYLAAWRKNSVIWANVKYMKELTHWSLEKIRRVRKRLIELGFIKDIQFRDENTGSFSKRYVAVRYFTVVPKTRSTVNPDMNDKMITNELKQITNLRGGGKPRRMKDDNLLLTDKDSSFSERYGMKIQNKLNLHSKYRPVSSKTWAKQINYLLQKMNISKDTFKEIINWYITKGTDYQYSPKIYKPEHLVEKWNQLQDAMIKYTTDQSESHTNYRMGPDGEYGYYEDDD